MITRYSNPNIIVVEQDSIEVEYLNGSKFRKSWDELTIELKKEKKKTVYVLLKPIEGKKIIITNSIYKFDELLKFINKEITSEKSS